MVKNDTATIVEALDVTCPSCAAGPGEPCSKYCDDDYVGTSKVDRRRQWDDGETW